MAALMARVEKALTISVLALVVTAASPQGRPDFSGHWIAVPEAAPSSASPGQPTGGFGSGLGADITITQTASAITVERAQFSQYDIQPVMKFVYALDGSDSRNVVNMGRGPQESSSRAAWQDGALVLATTYSFQDPVSGTPATSVLRQVFTLEGTDTLVVSATRGGLPDAAATSRQTFKKK